MAEINRQMWNHGAHIQTVGVPRQESLDRETVPKRMQ
jgi:hypothetical protein